MTQIGSFIRYTLVCGLILWPFSSDAYERISTSTYQRLTPVCKEWYERFHPDLVSRMPGSAAAKQSKYPSNYLLNQLGSAATPLNHYCTSMVFLIKAQYPYLIDPKSGETPELLLGNVRSGFDYLINYNKVHNDWNDSNKWLLAEAYSKLGDMESTGGHPERAIDNYRNAISTLPKYIPAYLGMAKSFEKLKLYPEAITSLKQASKYKPNSKAILRKINELEAKQLKKQPVEQTQ